MATGARIMTPPAGPAPVDAAPSTGRAAPVVVVQLSLAAAAAAMTVAIVTVARAAESGQTITYLLCFFVFLPAAVLAGRPLERVLGGLPSTAAAVLAAGAAGGVLAVILAARLVSGAGGDAAPVLIAGVVAWAVAVAAGLSAIRSGRRPPWLLAAGPREATAAWAVAGALALADVLAFVPDRVREPGPLAVSLILAAVLALVVLGAQRVRLPRGAGVALDVAAVVLIVLGVVDASSFLPQLPYDPVGALGQPFAVGDNAIGAQLVHQGFYLGPVNDVLHGRAVLVDTYSQYGVGVIYFLAAIFDVAPLGYGPMGLISSALTGVACAAGYGALRLAGCGRVTSAIALAAGIATTQLNTIGSSAEFPSTGALRFGPAYLLILLVVAGARWPARERALRVAALAVVALSAAWSAEALGYALAVYGAARAVEAAIAIGPARARLVRWIAEVGWAIAAAAAAIALVEVLTRVFAGSWPDWSPYLAFLNLYSSRTVPQVIVFPAISAWSTGFAVGALYLASAVATVRLTGAGRVRPELRPRLVAAAAITAFGGVSFSYWITHGAPFSLRWVALPAALVVALWVDLIVRARPALPRPVRLAGLGVGLWLAALVVVFAWPQVQATGERTALVHALPGAPSLRHDVGSLWHAPVVDPRAVEGEALLRRYAPHHRPVVVLTEGDLGLEILMRTGRTNAVPLGHPLQSDLIPTYVLARVRPVVDRLAPGTLALTEIVPDSRIRDNSNVLLHETIALLARRFTSRPVARTKAGLILVRLEPRPGAARR